ncbi:MAG: SDR family NAD(P)-dependent oxidoreductase [Candidatus Jordarchaeaceae archaeon]
MESRLSGKVALITGAASGIGRAIALRFAKEGAKVSIVDINIEGAKKVANEVKGLGGKALAVQCNVADEEDVSEAIEETEKKLGRIGILVSNAGILNYNLVHDIKTEQWKEIFKTNVDSLFYFSRALIKSMQKGDRIISISSVNAITGGVTIAHYAATKAAIIGFTRSLALEVAHKGVTVNTIAPALILTPMSKGLEQMPDYAKEIPIKRYGTPEDVAAVAAFLASSEAEFITGQVIIVDGGASLLNSTQRALVQVLGL